MTSTHLSQERLNQIAGRRLTELGVTCAIGPDGRIVGDLLTGALTSPFSGQPIGAVHFVVEGHDHMRFLSPPLLAGMAPLPFYEAGSVGEIVRGISQQLKRRVEAISRLKTHLHHLRVEADIDREHGALVAPVQIEGMGTVVLLGDEQGVRASHLRPLGGGANRPIPPVAIELSEFADATDLALFVGDLASRAKPAADAGPKTGIFRPPPELMAPRADVGVAAISSTGALVSADVGAVAQAAAQATQQATQQAALAGRDDEQLFMPPSGAFEVPQGIAGGARGQPATGDVPAGAVTAGMLARCLGESAQLAHGVAVMRRFSVGGRALKLALKQKRGRVFVGRIAFEDEVLWQGELQVDKHPPMDQFVRELVRSRGMALDEELPPAPASAPAAAAPRSSADWAAAQQAQQGAPVAASAPAPQPAFGHDGGEQLPVAGEIWVMNVIIEQQDGREVRYAAINAEGQPYGAPRILPKEQFDKVFAEHRGGFRLLVRVIGSSPQQVVYVQLDPSYQPNSETRAIAPSIFLANFLPEAADY